MSLKKLAHFLFHEESRKVDGSLFELKERELWWRDRYSLLESRGYRLRERLRPGWVPSWTTNPRLRPYDCEDAAAQLYPQIIDATRVRDGSLVIIKRLAKDTKEKTIAQYLSSFDDTTNHCVPIIDCFPDEKDANTEFIVMPLLRRFYDPPFYSVNEVVDFVRQTLEGIIFLHSKNVAHRDCSDLNIMLEGTGMFPEGFHPIRQFMNREATTLAKFKNRSDSTGVKYYFTDFGLSSHFDDADVDRLVTGRVCQVDVPELSDTVPYDPFAVDVYLLGDVYRRAFIEKYSNVQFLKPLVESMTREQPNERPKPREALKQLENIVSQRSKASLRWRLIELGKGRVSRFFVNISCIAREGAIATRRIIGIRSS